MVDYSTVKLNGTNNQLISGGGDFVFHHISWQVPPSSCAGKKTLVVEMGGSLFSADFGHFALLMADAWCVILGSKVEESHQKLEDWHLVGASCWAWGKGVWVPHNPLGLFPWPVGGSETPAISTWFLLATWAANDDWNLGSHFSLDWVKGKFAGKSYISWDKNMVSWCFL